MPTAMVINPGSGPVDGAKEEYAINNMRTWCAECEVDIVFMRDQGADEGGRFGFYAYHKQHVFRVLMPGLPYHKVAFTGSRKQNIWAFPRLYVNGGSWVWKFSLITQSYIDELNAMSDDDATGPAMRPKGNRGAYFEGSGGNDSLYGLE